MNIELRTLLTIHPYAKNPRKNDGAVDAVAESIRQFGFRQPIVVDGDGVIICGHTRFKAAQKLGLTEVPVHVAADLSPERVKALRIADNKTGELADWDDDLLASELGELGDEFDLEGFGFSEKELALLRADRREGLTDPDDVPLVPDEPITRPGDIITLGSHRILCGDATKTTDYQRLLFDASVRCVWTDPPYGVSIGDKNVALNSVGPSDRITEPIAGDGDIDEVRVVWTGAFNALFRIIPPGCPYYVCGPQGVELGFLLLLLLLLLLLRDAGLAPKHVLIWMKDCPTFSIGRLDYDYQHEPIIYGWKPGAAHGWHANDPQRSVIQCPRPKASKLHPTMKPVDLVVRMVENSTVPGDVVLAPFIGSGSTLIAAEKLDRRCFGMEISPRYCDVIVARWEAFTGRNAVRAKLDTPPVGGLIATVET